MAVSNASFSGMPETRSSRPTSRRTARVRRTPATFADLGHVLEANANQIRLRVPRGDVAAAAAALLSRERVADLTIEEPDVGSIIAGILDAREEPDA